MGQFEDLNESRDPRTIEQMVTDDIANGNVETVVITDVMEPKAYFDDERWMQELTWGSWGGIFDIPKGRRVEVGDEITIFNPDIGYERYGWMLNGEVMQYLTPWERFARRVERLAQHDREKRERFVKQQEKMDADYEALSPPLKARIDRFRNNDPSFRINGEEYELMLCIDADKIAAFLKPKIDAGAEPQDVVREFYDLGYEEQRRLIPNLLEGHSGNTFGGACSLAIGLLAGKEV